MISVRPGHAAVRRGRVRGWRQWTLRTRLATALTGIAAVALIGADTAGVVVLRTYLTAKVDQQVAGAARRALRQPPAAATLGAAAPRPGRAGDLLAYTYGGDNVLRGHTGDDQAPPRLPDVTALRGAAGAAAQTVAGAAGGSDWRMVVRARDDGGFVVVVGSLREVDATTRSLLVINGVALAAVLAGLSLVTYWVVRVGLSPLTGMGAIAAQISVGDLSRRVPVGAPHTEPGRLGEALNRMLGRLETEVTARATSEQRLRRFIADASHELRTPLTSIRGFAELYRRGGAPPGPELDETMGRIEDEAERMGLLVEDLLLVARLDLQRPQAADKVDLVALAVDTVRDARARAPQRPITLASLDDAWQVATVRGDEHRLRQVAANLVNNAIQHTPATASITVRIGIRDAAVAARTFNWAGGPVAVLEVADTGPGIAAADADRVFERLYRVDPSRTRAAGAGAGLGLAIASAIVASHGGTITLDTAPGRGATFRVLLPVATVASTEVRFTPAATTLGA